MDFAVTRTVITRLDTEEFPLTSGSIDLFETNFTFDSTWSEYEKHLIVSINGETYNTPIVNGHALIPNEALANPGSLKLGVFGINGTKILTSLWTPEMEVWPGAMDDDDDEEA